MAVDDIDILAFYDLPDTRDGLAVKTSAAVNGKGRQISLPGLLNELEMRILRVVEADNMVCAAEGFQFASQIQDHLLRPVKTTAAAQMENRLVHSVWHIRCLGRRSGGLRTGDVAPLP